MAIQGYRALGEDTTVLTVLQTCIGGIAGEFETLHGEMQLRQSGGYVGCGILLFFCTFFPQF